VAFHLKTNESVSAGILRNVRKQIEKAIEHLDAMPAGHERGDANTEAIGEVRKCFKRVRAALRLVREELGEDRYHEENYWFRDAARPLTQVRDAGVLLDTADKLRQQFPQAIATTTFAKIRRALLAHQAEVSRQVLEEDKAFATVKDAAVRALARLPGWELQRDGWAALEAGIRRVYHAGHRALALAVERSSVANLHEWRKQTSYLWHQLQLVEPSLVSAEKELVDKVHALSTLLGEDHDLAVLRETLAADPLSYGGHRVLKGVFELIDQQRSGLQRQAFALGRELYKNSPKEFTARIAASTRHEGSHEECRQG
jgi:CHAD domain-containing protein